MDADAVALAAASPRVQRALARLRSSGERVTPARHAVLRVVDEADGADEHLTAEQIGARVAGLAPTVHRATVYRTLTSLTDAGFLSHVHLGGASTIYHLADDTAETPCATSDPGSASLDPHAHAHVQCVVCGRVQDVSADVLQSVADRLEHDLGFVLETSHAALLGTCRACRPHA